MSLEQLPDTVIVQIIQHLPLNQTIRFGNVSSRFHQISALAVSETKELDLNDPVFQRIRPSSLSALLSLCFDRLERMTFAKSFDRSLIETFAEFAFPRLNEIRIDHTRMGNDLFGTLLKKNANVKTFIWTYNSTPPIFPVDTVSGKLETVKISCFDDGSFRSMIGRCPNLKHFETEVQNAVSREALDDFFAAYPRLETLVFREVIGNFAFGSLHHFWQLESLRTLIVCADPSNKFTDLELGKVATSFQKLEKLGLVWLSATKEGISSLAALPNLRKVAFENTTNAGDGELDEGFHRIAQCGRLQELQFYNSISQATFKFLIQLCPDLRFLCVWKIRGVTTPELAVELVQSFGAVEGVEVAVRICHEVSEMVWQSATVQAALQQMRMNGGRVIRSEGGQNIRFWDCV